MPKTQSRDIAKALMRQAKLRGMRYGLIAGVLLCSLLAIAYITSGASLQDYLLYQWSISPSDIYLYLFLILVGCLLLGIYGCALKTLRAIDHAIKGHCMHCGYDLRGEDQMCPECGKAQQELFRRFNDWYEHDV
ncbi:MAG: hypothetical protein ACF8OB_08085 [Phycisphaeraceae bacterium JB051]